MPLLKEKEKMNTNQQNAKVYDGLNGLQTAFNDILISLKPGDEYFFFQVPNRNLFNKQITRFFRSYHLRRAEKKIRLKGLAQHSSKKIVKEIFKDLRHTDIRYLKEFTPNGVVIYSNKIIILDWENVPTAFVIQSNAIVNSYKKFFLEKWKKASD